MLDLPGSKRAALALGTSWELTCYRDLQQTVTATAVVIGTDAERVTDVDYTRTKFNLDIACCDIDDKDVSFFFWSQKVKCGHVSIFRQKPVN